MRHRHPKLRPIHIFARLFPSIKQQISRSCSIPSQLPQIMRAILIHLLGYTDIIVTSNTSSLTLAEDYWSLVLAYGLVGLAESVLVAFEVYEGILVWSHRGVY